MEPGHLTADVELADGPPRRRIDLHDTAQRHEVERSLETIPGVCAARLVPGYERDIDELHVVATVDRVPKQVARDLQSVLLARHGITTDHRVISVVAVDRGVGAGDSRPRRVTISRVTVVNQGLTSRVEVVVADGTGERTGQADGPASNTGRRRAVARATLAAVRPLLGQDRIVEIDGVEVTEVLGHEVALSFIHFHTVDGERTNCGSAVVQADESDAVARSVLDAVNRMVDGSVG